MQLLVAFFVGALTNFSYQSAWLPVFRLAPGFLDVVLKGQFPDQSCGEVSVYMLNMIWAFLCFYY